MSLPSSISKWLSPLHSIAEDLRIIRELYELDLRERGVMRQTQKPQKDDVEVSYGDEDEGTRRRSSWLRRGEVDEILDGSDD